jgi:subtilisin family serine protease
MAQVLQYYSGGRKQRVELKGILEGRQNFRGRADAPTMRYPLRPQNAGTQVLQMLAVQPMALRSRLSDFSESSTMIQPVNPGRTTVIPTETIAVLGAKVAELRWVRHEFGLTVLQEGSHGKVLLRVPADGTDRVARAFAVARRLYERGNVDGAHPNFLRLVQRPGPASGGLVSQWGLCNEGSPGTAGADVAAEAAWTLTTGSGHLRVAVLDEGVDTKHPYLKSAVRAQRDFVDDNKTAAPDFDDAHGTACAGIIASRGPKVKGLAPGVGLVAVRIAKGGGQGWIFDDFNTADAIDWAWDEAKSDVLSNSWGGGPEVDVITAAFDRAIKRGRGGKGAVVIVAAGNAQAQLSYPGNLPDVLTVGASNQWDERKTRTSQDGEIWWGSNFGLGLDLMAPGVGILTTDISGPSGYGPELTTPDFNGTSAATPFAAAAAALVLSVRPNLTEKQVREVLVDTTDAIGNSKVKWNKLVGHGRLNAFAAMRAALRK